MAIQYGMPLDEFWHGDIELLECYQKAYLRNKSYTAWLNGVHIYEAAYKAVSNCLRTKRSDPIEKYSDWKDPVESNNKKKMVIENVEKEFREQQVAQNAWLFGR